MAKSTIDKKTVKKTVKKKKDIELSLSGSFNIATIKTLEKKYKKDISKVSENDSINICIEKVELEDITSIIFIYALLKECMLKTKYVTIKVTDTFSLELLNKYAFLKSLKIMGVTHVN